MADKSYTITTKEGAEVQVFFKRDKRLKKSVRWGRQADGSVLVRMPPRYPKAQIPILLAHITAQFDKYRQRAKRRTDDDLQERAQYLNRTCFQGKINWEAIRWVPPMRTRLGSCTGGGPTDGHIRISEEIREWPQWVVDYVIAHELTHRLHPNHSPDFWQTLSAAYPLTERARGFIKGVGFAKGRELDEGE